MAGIHPAEQLTLVEPEGDGVIRLPRPGLPRGLLASQHHRQAIRVGERFAYGFKARTDLSLYAVRLGHRHESSPVVVGLPLDYGGFGGLGLRLGLFCSRPGAPGVTMVRSVWSARVCAAAAPYVDVARYNPAVRRRSRALLSAG